MGLDIDGKLLELNSRLKAAGTRVTVQRRGGTLLLRGTFPPRPHSDKTKPYQQRIFLGLKASVAGIKAAEQQAKIISAQLELGQFRWEDWFEEEDKTEFRPVSFWLERFEEDFWSKREKNIKSLRTWESSYQRAFVKLPKDETLTLELLLEVIRLVKPNTKTRQVVCQHFVKLALLAELPGIEKITELKGSYSPKAVNPRNLPPDNLIAETVNAITHPGWRWLVGILATYGLRSHEAFELDFTEFPVVRVLKGKTGERIVYPLYPEWSHKWRLDQIILPPISLEQDGKRSIGQRIARWFWAQKFPFRAYDLRHCYARRCFEFDIPTNRAAKLMGHEEVIHNKVYRAWIDEKYYREKFDRDVFGKGKPKAPS
jgi:hypothetical protein